MNGGAPRCPACGGLSTNPNDTQCRFCGAALGQRPQHQQHHAPQQPGYGAPPQHAYAPQPYAPQPYAPQPYAPQPYAPPPPGNGAPNPYGGPQPGPYPMAPVQSFGGGYGRQVNHGVFGSSGWSSFFWFRLILVGVAVSLSLLGACISAITN